MPPLNLIIVTPDATYVAFQSDTWADAQAVVSRMLQDPWYRNRVAATSPLFIKEGGQEMIQTTAKEFADKG